MKRNRTILAVAMTAALLFSTNFVYAESSAYSSQNIGGIQVNYVTVDMNDKNIKPVMLNAQNHLNSTDSLANMAVNAQAFAAVNGTYFQAYGGIPVSWGTMIKDGKVLHISQSGAVFGITSSGKFLVDRLTFDFAGYINGEYRAIPWRVNHPSVEDGAITIFTPEYRTAVNVTPGAKAVIVQYGKFTQVVTQDFYIPTDGFAIVYNPAVSYLVDERYHVGDEISYTVKINTTFTNSEEWDDVVVGLGAGPSLIINGVVTAQGETEGFTEAKINTNASARSFIGATAGGKIIIGTIPSATLMQAAQACQSMGLVNAMCLDGGGSSALYYPAAGINKAGRNINNGLGFVDVTKIYTAAKPTSSTVLVDEQKVGFTAYNIAGSNYFKLRDLAMALSGSEKEFEIAWDSGQNAIRMIPGEEYTEVGGELSGSPGSADQKAYASTAKVYFGEEAAELTAYNIGGNNYFKLRDVGGYAGFGVDWDGSQNTITITTSSEN